MDKKLERFQSITRFLYVTTQLAALTWVSLSYLLAAYSTIRLRQPYPIVDLSKQAIVTILGINIVKLAENVFEHGVFGSSKSTPDSSNTVEDDTELSV